VPEALLRALDRWDEQGRPEQPASKWSLRSWQAFLPQHAQYIASLPNPINRAAVQAEVARASDSPDTAVRAFVATMVWGYGRVGYGAYRTAKVLADNPSASEVLMDVAAEARRHGGPAAFERMAKSRLTGLGVAFATKYLFFCSLGYDVPPAPILDRLVRNWLASSTGWRINLDWRVRDYRAYVQTVVAWGAELGIDPAHVEYLMFADALATEPASQWAGAVPAGNRQSALASAASLDPVTADEAAVLEALNEAAEAFAALPEGADLHDAEDFEQGLRQLRRIVLAGRRITRDSDTA
jgi:hypothetical protein